MMKKRKNIIIKTKDQFEKIMRKRRDDADHRRVNPDAMQKDSVPVNHIACVNGVLKLIHCTKMDPIVKKVLTMRLTHPVMFGKERSHLSISLELGVPEYEVKQIEKAGIQIVDGYLQRFSTKEFIDKFNREQSIRKTIEKG